MKTFATGHSAKGVPDILCVINGRFVAFEVKRPDRKGTVTPVQRKNLNQIALNGGVGVVIEQVESIEPIYQAILTDDFSNLEVVDELPVFDIQYRVHEVIVKH